MSIVNSVLGLFVGDKAKKDLKQIEPILNNIKTLEASTQSLSNDELRAKTQHFKKHISLAMKSVNDKMQKVKEDIERSDNMATREEGYLTIDKLKEDAYKIQEKTLNELLPEAFAVVKATAKRFSENSQLEVIASEDDRTFSASRSYIRIEDNKAIWSNSWNAAGKEVSWDMVHYDVQLVGGIAMHQGKIAEMQTGEGKTLAATLPLYLNALTTNGVHLVTVNDYLAKRDSMWMAPIFEFHGLTVDCIDRYEPNSEERRKAYLADITYGTNNEFGFDYLRDNMSRTTEDLVQQRLHNFAIVDEVDSVLIDDARTPLIISGPVPEGNRHEFDQLKPVVADLVSKQKQFLTEVLSESKKIITSGDIKQGGFLLYRVYRGLPKNKSLIKFLSKEGMRQLLQKNENYHMQDNNREMPKVDAELYFTIDEKNNNIELTEKGIEYLSEKHEKDFFILPDIGTEIVKIESQKLLPEDEIERKDELFKEFSIKSERIHTINQLFKAYTLFEKDIEYVVMNNKVMIVDEQTGRVMEGRRYSDGLHQAIEAKENAKIEAATQTFATITLQNYFRMYNKLSGMTGTAITEAGEFWEIYKLDVMEIPTNRAISRIDLNDCIYKTKREKYNAIIEEIVRLSSSGRPVLIGTTSVEVSELLGKMLTLRRIKHNVLNAKLHKKEADVVAEAGKSGVVTIATNMAGRGTDIKITEEVKKAGGLAIVGTERHDSRRVDRQLRGRSGRQGDPGSSQFYVSLEDNLMRLFGSERMAKIMDRMGLKEGEVIQHSMMNKSIERAQKKVEENNFGIRKRLLEYDNVMNAQREVIYKRRRNALEGRRLKLDVSNMVFDICEAIITTIKPTNNYKNFNLEFIKHFSVESPVSKNEFEKISEPELITKIYNECYSHYKERMVHNAETAFPIIKRVYEDPANKFERIVVPFSDGIKTLSVVTDMEQAYNSKGEQLIFDFEKNVTLAIIDEHWKDHLRNMDNLKQSVQLAVHEQKDPLLIYKFEAFELFKSMIDQINREIILFLFKGDLPKKDDNEITEAQEVNSKINQNDISLSKEEALNMSQMASAARQAGHSVTPTPKVETIVRETPKIGRNDRVTIVHTISGQTKEIKYKQALPLINKGEWVISN